MIQECLKVLRGGGVILYPTDTIWGLGCDATNKKAVERLFLIKQRSEGHPLIVLASDDRMINRMVPDAPAASWDIIEQHEGPVTIVYENAGWVAPNVLGSDGTCGIRLVKDEFCRTLIHKFQRPVVSTSANISGNRAPENYEEISPRIKEAVDFIVPLRQLEKNLPPPSPVILIRNNGEVKVLRK
ncbi:MAG: threonylcarbamoyl-AMP synthase [Bacteroidia bacterium]|nr:threonylcarbamoyl-AMP synthase [Bacteroidia bacterium]